MMTNQLYLADWTVLDVTDDPDTYRISAQYDVQPDACEKLEAKRRSTPKDPRILKMLSTMKSE